MSYSAAVFFVDLESGSDTARTALTGCVASNPSGTITRINKTGHGLVAGAVVDGTLFTAWLNAAWKITPVDADNFDLDGAVWQATADPNGTMTPRGGSSKADAWKNFPSSVRHQALDQIRLMASPDLTSLGVTGAFTQDSKTVTLSAALTQLIDDCETAYTASTNITATADTSGPKSGSKACKLVSNGSFTTGKMAYFATGTLDLSAYQQVTFWVQANAAIAASTLSIRLCSDTTGDVTVNTVAVPACANANLWTALTVDLAGALGASIQSIAVYADLAWTSKNLFIDNVNAVKSAASADCLSLTSLIGKVHNLNWVASTTYASNSIRRPTVPNRNGFCYKVTAGGGGSAGGSEPTWPVEIGLTVVDGALTWTCFGLEDTWYPIQSINGTTVKVDNTTGTANNSAQPGKGYPFDTETVDVYKREPIKAPMSSGNFQTTTQTGSSENYIFYSGGWNRTDMTTETGETWVSGQNGTGIGIAGGINCHWCEFKNLNFTRLNLGYSLGSVNYCRIKNSHCAGVGGPIALGTHSEVIGSCCVNAVATAGVMSGSVRNKYRRISATGNIGNGVTSGPGVVGDNFTTIDVGRIYNNLSNGVDCRDGSQFFNVITERNNVGIVGDPDGGINQYARFCNFKETNKFDNGGNVNLGKVGNLRLYSKDDAQVVGTDVIRYRETVTVSSTIASATDQRHTAAGKSWKFNPKDTGRNAENPLTLSVAKVPVNANALVTATIWVRRDSTNIHGRLRAPGAQLAGVPVDAVVLCSPSINSWIQYTLTFTPTEAGVIEIVFDGWDYTGTTNSLWIHDFDVSQA